MAVIHYDEYKWYGYYLREISFFFGAKGECMCVCVCVILIYIYTA